jgi:linoleate 10R-lipoxygenase
MFTKQPRRAEHHELVKRLAKLGQSSDDLATSILALMVAATVELSLGARFTFLFIHEAV